MNVIQRHLIQKQQAFNKYDFKRTILIKTFCTLVASLTGAGQTILNVYSVNAQYCR